MRPKQSDTPKAAPRATAGRPRKIAEGALVEAALRVLEREGYAALTIRSLAQELGISHSTLYNYVERVEDIEAQALQKLTAQLPMPAAASPHELRADLLAYLMATRRLLLQHPNVLLPPPGSPSWKTLEEIGEKWLRALLPHAPDEKTARLALAALVATVVVQAQRSRIYGAAPPPKRQSAAGLTTLEEALDAMIDLVLPGLSPGKNKAP